MIALMERVLPAAVLDGARRVAGWALAVGVVWAVAGPLVGVAWCAVAGWHLVRPPSPRVLTAASVWLFALVPVLWVVGNRGRLGQVSTQLVLADRAPGLVAATALALLVTGVWRDVVRAAPETQPRRETEPQREEQIA
jgi:hypothetical protein